MADRLMRFFALALITAPALAQSVPAGTPLADPTRPPASMSGAPAQMAEETSMVLQSVIIPKKGKPVAIIGGQQVSLGGKFGDYRLVSLSEREAVLEGPGGIERLLLTPGIQKTNSSAKKTPASLRGQSKGKP